VSVSNTSRNNVVNRKCYGSDFVCVRSNFLGKFS